MSKKKPYNGKYALYLEDQQTNVRAITDMLQEKLGLKVVLKDTFESARNELINDDAIFDLIILDMRIWDQEADVEEWRLYGEKLLEIVREGGTWQTPKNVPVLVISGVVDTADEIRITEKGTDNDARFVYLHKPVTLMEVEEAVKYLFEKTGNL